MGAGHGRSGQRIGDNGAADAIMPAGHDTGGPLGDG
jgi:hypothetical protein